MIEAVRVWSLCQRFRLCAFAAVSLTVMPVPSAGAIFDLSGGEILAARALLIEEEMMSPDAPVIGPELQRALAAYAEKNGVAPDALAIAAFMKEQAKARFNKDFSPPVEAAVIDSVKAVLLDPYTAHVTLWYWFSDKDVPGDIVVCGSVNAKNAFGGYTGETPFYSTVMASTSAPMAISVVDDPQNDMAGAHCQFGVSFK